MTAEMDTNSILRKVLQSHLYGSGASTINDATCAKPDQSSQENVEMLQKSQEQQSPSIQSNLDVEEKGEIAKKANLDSSREGSSPGQDQQSVSMVSVVSSERQRELERRLSKRLREEEEASDRSKRHDVASRRSEDPPRSQSRRRSTSRSPHDKRDRRRSRSREYRSSRDSRDRYNRDRRDDLYYKKSSSSSRRNRSRSRDSAERYNRSSSYRRDADRYDRRYENDDDYYYRNARSTKYHDDDKYRSSGPRRDRSVSRDRYRRHLQDSSRRPSSDSKPASSSGNSLVSLEKNNSDSLQKDLNVNASNENVDSVAKPPPSEPKPADYKRQPRPASNSMDEQLARLDLTVGVKNIHSSTRDSELRRFFERKLNVEVVSAKIVRDSRTSISKGIGYVEFRNLEDVPRALDLTGQEMNGNRIEVSTTEQERMLLMKSMAMNNHDPNSMINEVYSSRVLVTNIPLAVKEPKLRETFQKFGVLKTLNLQRDQNGQSKGIAYLAFTRVYDARKAKETMNGFVLGGQHLKVSLISDTYSTKERLELAEKEIEEERGQVLREEMGEGSGKVSRIELMAKLAERDNIVSTGDEDLQKISEPEVPARNCLLTNMFDPAEETEPGWEKEIEDDVVSESSKFGVITKCLVDKLDPNGHVYLRFEDAESCQRCIQALNGRWFAGKQISASLLNDQEFDKLAMTK